MKKEGKHFIADRRLYLTANRQRVVEEGDPDAAFLYAAPGHKIPAEMVEKHGLENTEDEKPGTVPPKKAAKKSANKAKKKSANKKK